MNKNSILTPFIYHCCIINYDINDSHALSVYFYDILIVTSVFDQTFDPYLQRIIRYISGISRSVIAGRVVPDVDFNKSLTLPRTFLKRYFYRRLTQ